MPLITAPLQTMSMGTNILTPVQHPEDARWNAGTFAASISWNAGQTLIRTTNGLFPYAAFGASNAVGLAMYTGATDANGNVYYGGSTNASAINPGFKDSPYFTSGDFDTAQLYTFDSTARTQLGGVVMGGANTNWVHIP